LLVTTENLAEMLEVNPNTIINWGMCLGLNIKTDDLDVINYSEDLINFFKKVKSLVLNGYTLASIKEFLSVEIEIQNKIKKPTEAVIVEVAEDKDKNKNRAKKVKETITFVGDNELKMPQENFSSRDDRFSSFKETLNNNVNQSDVIVIFEALLKELKQYTERTMEAEKKVYLLEDFENRVKQEYYELSTDVKQLKIQLEEKNQKLKDYEDQKKRLSLLEVQLKIMQLEKNKKKFWEFWKPS